MDLVKDYLMSSACRVFQGVSHQFVATAERINCVQMESQSPVHSIQSVQQCLCVWWRYRKNVTRCCSLPFEQLSTRTSKSGRARRMNLTAHVRVCSWVPHELTSKRTVLNMETKGGLVCLNRLYDAWRIKLDSVKRLDSFCGYMSVYS